MRIRDLLSWYWFVARHYVGLQIVWDWLMGRLVCAWLGHRDEQALEFHGKPGAPLDECFEPCDTWVCQRCGRWEEAL